MDIFVISSVATADQFGFKLDWLHYHTALGSSVIYYFYYFFPVTSKHKKMYFDSQESLWE